ncbi:hypothetical protein SynA18461_00981 [Synechococcus sp. A18-46.1]|nr:hypothetical protein SynA18461_00981 [Synechococcus sp. A18-46.1]
MRADKHHINRAPDSPAPAPLLTKDAITNWIFQQLAVE